MTKYDYNKIVGARTPIKSPNGYRYYLLIETIAKNDNEIVIIMFNPSCANEKESDPTINSIIKNMYNKYKFIHIVNLSPEYAEKPTDLEYLPLKIMFNNIVIINNLINEKINNKNCYICIANGDIINSIQNGMLKDKIHLTYQIILQNLYINKSLNSHIISYGITNKGHGAHLSNVAQIKCKNYYKKNNLKIINTGTINNPLYKIK